MNETILLVDDDPSAIKLMAHILADVADLRFATSGEQALRIARAAAPDLILLDAQMPSMSGFAAFDALKAESVLADVPVIFVTSHSEAAFEVTALQMGAADFIAKPFIAELVRARVTTHLRVKRLSDELRRRSAIDEITGVANRAQFDEFLRREWLRARRGNNPMGLLMIDLDHFKLYNERYGSAKGDACLRRVAQALIGTGRHPADFLARCGGHEFVMLLPDTPRSGAQHVANRVLAVINALGISHPASPTAGRLTASIGIASYDEESPRWVESAEEHRSANASPLVCTAEELIFAAEKALGHARRAGYARASLVDVGEINYMAHSPEFSAGVEDKPPFKLALA